MQDLLAWPATDEHTDRSENKKNNNNKIKKGHILKNTQEHNIRTELLYILEAVTSEILYKSTEKW